MIQFLRLRTITQCPGRASVPEYFTMHYNILQQRPYSFFIMVYQILYKSRNKKQTGKSCLFQHRDGHTWLSVTGHVCPWETSARAQGSSAWGWAPTFTASRHLSRAPPLTAKMFTSMSLHDPHIKTSQQSPRASNHTPPSVCWVIPILST